MEKYTITGNNGMAKYIMKAGKDIVKAEMSLETAERIASSGDAQNKAMALHPTFCVNVGDYYFQGRWEKPERKQKNIFSE